MKKGPIKLIECPRDAMQGWKSLIPAEKKADYINTLLEVGFDTIDFGSFVSPKAIPQMADTSKVVTLLRPRTGGTKLLAIIANQRGAEEASLYDQIHYLGFPFSISETFQYRNTHSTIQESLKRVEAIQDICRQKDKELVVYISMAFGNPYGDTYSEEIAYEWAARLAQLDIKTISLADTVGIASPDQVYRMTRYLVESLPEIEIGVHLHSTADNWQLKLEAAVNAGCLRFDGALKGIGGCPMANDELVGNMNTEWMIDFFEKNQIMGELNQSALEKSLALATEIFV